MTDRPETKTGEVNKLKKELAASRNELKDTQAQVSNLKNDLAAFNETKGHVDTLKTELTQTQGLIKSLQQQAKDTAITRGEQYLTMHAILIINQQHCHQASKALEVHGNDVRENQSSRRPKVCIHKSYPTLSNMVYPNNKSNTRTILIQHPISNANRKQNKSQTLSKG
jgi:uncharacterized protein YhaN